MTTLGLDALPDRCANGYAPVMHPSLCACDEMGEWAIFVRALRSSVRDDRTIHQGDVRPLIRGRIEPKHVGTLYRRAKSARLIRDTGQLEPSTDVAGRNADKVSRIYEWIGRAA